MNTQLALNYSPTYLGREKWRQRAELLRAAVNHLGLKEAAFAFDASGSHLSDAINERERKRWAGEWIDIAIEMLTQKSDEIAIDIVRRLLELWALNTGFAITDDTALTPEEEAAALRRELLKFGESGKAAVERVKRRARR